MNHIGQRSGTARGAPSVTDDLDGRAIGGGCRGALCVHSGNDPGDARAADDRSFLRRACVRACLDRSLDSDPVMEIAFAKRQEAQT